MHVHALGGGCHRSDIVWPHIKKKTLWEWWKSVCWNAKKQTQTWLALVLINENSALLTSCYAVSSTPIWGDGKECVTSRSYMLVSDAGIVEIVNWACARGNIQITQAIAIMSSKQCASRWLLGVNERTLKSSWGRFVYYNQTVKFVFEK